MGFVHCRRSANGSFGRSWARRLQQALELLGIAAFDEEAVWIVPIGQGDSANGLALLLEPVRQPLCRLLAATVAVGVKGEIDGSRAVAQLPKLVCIEMVSHRAGEVVKTGLPQHGVVEETLDENHFRASPDLLP